MARRKRAQRQAASKNKEAQAEAEDTRKEEIPQEEEEHHDSDNNQPQEEQVDKKRKGKRKMEEADEQPSKTIKRPRKRLKSDNEPEFLEEKRNLEDLWKEVHPIGTEWDQLHLVYQYNWNFTNLESAFEEGGKLYGKKVYLFGCTEHQMAPFKDEMQMTYVPVIVAVVSPFPPSDKIGINSVQREAEEIVPMKLMKMDWVPYIPLENRASMVERLKSEIFILSCSQRRSALRHLKEDQVKKFEYCLPYFYNPLQEYEPKEITIVPILFPIEPKPVVCEFDWELDKVEQFTDKLIEEEELPADQKEEFQKFLKEKVREAKKANREARGARKKAKEDTSAEKKGSFENIRFYKFYPVRTPDTPDISDVKVPFINKYYGKAHQIF